MPRSDYMTCRNCDRPSSVCGSLSHTRLCGDCAYLLLASNVAQMVDRRGPNWKAWRRGMVLCAYPDLLDALPPRA